MLTTQASVTLPVSRQWVWHHVSNVQHWAEFLPCVQSVQSFDHDRYIWELRGPLDGAFRSRLLTYQPPELLEWEAAGNSIGLGGSIELSREGFQTTITVTIMVEGNTSDLRDRLQAELERGMKRLELRLLTISRQRSGAPVPASTPTRQERLEPVLG
jgi:carbon monoxide dehydrogenase subunit G